MGTAAAIARAAGPFQGLRGGWSSGQNKLEYTAAMTTRPFRSKTTRQSNALDSDPDHLLLADEALAGFVYSFYY